MFVLKMDVYGGSVSSPKKCLASPCTNVAYLSYEGKARVNNPQEWTIASTKPYQAEMFSHMAQSADWRCQTFVPMPASQNVVQVGTRFLLMCMSSLLFTFDDEKINLIFLTYK